MGAIRQTKERELLHYLDEAESILANGGMDREYAHGFVEKLSHGKKNHILQKDVSNALHRQGYKRAGQWFLRAEKHNTRDYDWEKIDAVGTRELGEAMWRIREYLMKSR